MFVNREDFKRELGNIYDDFNLMVDKTKGHVELHCGQSQSEELNRIFSENIEAACSFYDEETMNWSVSNAIDYKSDEIYNWLTSSKLDFPNTKKGYDDYWNHVIEVSMGETLGNGIKKENLQEYETPVVTVVLRRDNSKTAPLGFYLKTAYPQILSKEAGLTGRNIERTKVLSSDKIKGTTNKTFYILKNKFPTSDIKKYPAKNGNNEYVKMCVQSPNFGKVQLFLDEDGKSRLTSFDERNGKQNVSYADFLLRDEYNAKLILEAMDIHDRVINKTIFTEKDLYPAQEINFSR